MPGFSQREKHHQTQQRDVHAILSVCIGVHPWLT